MNFQKIWLSSIAVFPKSYSISLRFMEALILRVSREKINFLGG